MIVRSSADMVDLLLFSLGPAETLGWMTTPVGVNTYTQTHRIMFRNENKSTEGIKTNSNNVIRERKKKKVIDHWSRGRAGRNGEENGSAQGGLGVLVLYFVSCISFLFLFLFRFFFFF